MRLRSYQAADLRLFDQQLHWNGDRAPVWRIEVRNTPEPTAASANEQTDFGHPLLTLKLSKWLAAIRHSHVRNLLSPLERVKRLENANEDFLRGILRILALAEHSNGDVQDPGLMPREQSLECVAISSLGFGTNASSATFSTDSRNGLLIVAETPTARLILEAIERQVTRFLAADPGPSGSRRDAYQRRHRPPDPSEATLCGARRDLVSGRSGRALGLACHNPPRHRN